MDGPPLPEELLEAAPEEDPAPPLLPEGAPEEDPDPPLLDEPPEAWATDWGRADPDSFSPQPAMIGRA